MRLVVTGATGFIGAELCACLASQGDQVTALVRHGSHAPRCVSREVILEELTTSAQWCAALAGHDAIVHLAARTHRGEGVDSQTLSEFWQTNVELTRALAVHATAVGVGNFVFMSSSKVSGERSPRIGPEQWGNLSHASPPAPEGPYGQSKLEAERLLGAIIAASGTAGLTILRPPLVYGPGVGGNLLSLLRAIANGIPLPLASIVNRRSLVDRKYLLDAILLSLKSPRVGMRTFTVTDCALSTPALCALMAHGLKRRLRLWHCPVALLRRAGKIVGRSAQVARLTESMVLDSRAIEDELGWRPAIDLDRAWSEIGLWYYRTH
ncbi:MAG: NAD-dependent epimerase/dehydratase family protein [Gammaproteobacteria bacterium]|nr:NAD-dependent epimerase/dehydratase family protein [Gammaproteobacteria bacterium]